MSTRAKRGLIRRSSLTFHFFILLLLFPNQQARADEIAIWNFNDSNVIVDQGLGNLSTNFTAANLLFAPGTATNARQGNLAGQALSLQGGTGTANNGRHITINVSTLGFSGISVSFATQGSSTSFNVNQFQYSLDGVTFVDFMAPYAPAAAFGAIPTVFDLSSITGLNNNAAAAFRILFSGATPATGNNRIDSLVVDGRPGTTTTVPEPAAMFLLGSGLTTLVGLLRRRGNRHFQSPTSTNGAQ